MKKRRLFDRFVCTLLIAVFVMSFAACGSRSDDSEPETQETEEESRPVIIIETEEEETEEEIEEEEEVLEEGMMRSYLTGEVVSEDVGLSRPFAVMINNIQESLPQSGVGSAEIIYEALVEGGITRLMAFFQDVEDVEKIGSIRSLRHYYIDFADDNDAMIVHYGQTTYAQDEINERGLVTINGLSGYESVMCYRTSDRVAPHNVFSNGEMLLAGAEYRGLSRDYPEDYTPRLLFNLNDTVPESGTAAGTVSINFNSKPYFVYDDEDGLYYRYQFNEPHIDDNDGSQLAFKNIIIQYVSETSINDKDRQNLTLTGSGEGYFITDGTAVPITWERPEKTDRTKYYDSEGEQISLNPGKTMFEVIPDTAKVYFE